MKTINVSNVIALLIVSGLSSNGQTTEGAQNKAAEEMRVRKAEALKLELKTKIASGKFSSEKTTDTTKNVTPAQIDAALVYAKNLPYEGVGQVSGHRIYDRNFSKLQRMDVVPGSSLHMGVRSYDAAVFICAEELFIQRPSDLNNVSCVSYYLGESLDGGEQAQAASGGHAVEGSGQAGGNGANGLQGMPGGIYDAPTIYFIFRKLTVQNASSSNSTLLDFYFDGMKGGNGGRGQQGGNAGNGGRGTDAEDGRILGNPSCCAAGPGRGGNTGRPGTGGKGGAAGRGGHGGHVVIICPQSEYSKVAFAASVNPGIAGNAGGPGAPGKIGTPGGGGNLSTFCRGGRGTGDILQPSPVDYGMGDKGINGTYGSFQVEVRNVDAVFAP